MKFPTPLHERAAELFAGFAGHRDSIDTVLVVNSCAWGKATAQSDLDMAALVKTGTPASELKELEESWNRLAARNPAIAQFQEMSPFCKVHIDFFDGAFAPAVWDEGGGPDRKLHFQAFDRLYKAFQELLQCLFISRRTYPVAYNKWIHEQVVEWLELPDLYEDLPRILSVKDLEGEDILDNAQLQLELLHQWLPSPE
jgi:hypothetical protein